VAVESVKLTLYVTSHLSFFIVCLCCRNSEVELNYCVRHYMKDHKKLLLLWPHNTVMLIMEVMLTVHWYLSGVVVRTLDLRPSRRWFESRS